MADKNLPDVYLPEGAVAPPLDDAVAERRAFLKRAALVGLPVLIATVPGRVAWAGDNRAAGALQATCGASMGCPSVSATTTDSII